MFGRAHLHQSVDKSKKMGKVLHKDVSIFPLFFVCISWSEKQIKNSKIQSECKCAPLQTHIFLFRLSLNRPEHCSAGSNVDEKKDCGTDGTVLWKLISVINKIINLSMNTLDFLHKSLKSSRFRFFDFFSIDKVENRVLSYVFMVFRWHFLHFLLYKFIN